MGGRKPDAILPGPPAGARQPTMRGWDVRPLHCSSRRIFHIRCSGGSAPPHAMVAGGAPRCGGISHPRPDPDYTPSRGRQQYGTAHTASPHHRSRAVISPDSEEPAEPLSGLGVFVHPVPFPDQAAERSVYGCLTCWLGVTASQEKRTSGGAEERRVANPAELKELDRLDCWSRIFQTGETQRERMRVHARVQGPGGIG